MSESPQTTRRPIPESEVQAMLEQRRAGASELQIARDFHRSVKRVKAVMLEHAVQIIGFIPASRVAELFGLNASSISSKRFQRAWGLDKISRAWDGPEKLWDEAQVLECVKGRLEHKAGAARASNITHQRRESQLTGFISSPQVAKLLRVSLMSLWAKKFKQQWGLEKVTKAQWHNRRLMWDESQILEIVRLRLETKAILRPKPIKATSVALEQRIIRHFKTEGTANQMELDLYIGGHPPSLDRCLQALLERGTVVRCAFDRELMTLSKRALS